MTTYLNRYSAKLALLISPLRDLIKKNALFKWEEQHQTALNSVISCYDRNPGTVTVLQCDASQEAWIRQIVTLTPTLTIKRSSQCPHEHSQTSKGGILTSNVNVRPWHMVLRSSNSTFWDVQPSYRQITHHSNRYSKKSVREEVPGRLQRLLLRCLRFDVQVKYKLGKTISVADTLSRVLRQITTNQRQCRVLCYRHTLPYRHQHSEIRISAGPGHDQAKGRHLRRMACPQEGVPT